MSDNVEIGIVGGGRIGKAIYHLLIDGNICQDVYLLCHIVAWLLACQLLWQRGCLPRTQRILK